MRHSRTRLGRQRGDNFRSITYQNFSVAPSANATLLIDRNRGGSRGGLSPPLKPAKVILSIMIFYNSENNIRDTRLFFRPLFGHSSVVKYASSLLQQGSRYETWPTNTSEIPPPLTLLAGSTLGFALCCNGRLTGAAVTCVTTWNC